MRETRGLSQVGMMVDKEFLPRFRYINRLLGINIKGEIMLKMAMVMMMLLT